MSERIIVVTEDGFGTVTSATCQACGKDLPRPDAFHSEATCLLVRSGFDADKEIREAAKHLPPLVPEFVSRQKGITPEMHSTNAAVGNGVGVAK